MALHNKASGCWVRACRLEFRQWTVLLSLVNLDLDSGGTPYSLPKGASDKIDIIKFTFGAGTPKMDTTKDDWVAEYFKRRLWGGQKKRLQHHPRL